MSKSRIVWSLMGLVAGLGLLAAGALVEAGRFNSKVDIGDVPAAWSDLPGVDGKQYALKDYRDKDAVVVVFTCNNCPVAKAYEDRVMALAKQYEDKPVAFVAINVNEGEDLKAMAKRAEEKGFNFPYVYDASQKSAENYGAECTPHAFVLNKKRAIAYMGSIDDNMNEEEVEQHYLQEAIASVLGGKDPEVKETRQFGCSVKWR